MLLPFQQNQNVFHLIYLMIRFFYHNYHQLILTLYNINFQLYTSINKIMSIDKLAGIDYCAGTTRYETNSEFNWYGFNDIPTSIDTRCQYCFNHLKKIKPSIGMYKLLDFQNINCDSIKDPSVTALVYNGFTFKVLNRDKTMPYIIYPETSVSRKE